MTAAASPARALRDRVEAMHQPGDRITLLSDSESYVDRVLVAFRLPTAAFVIAIDRSEYDGMAVLRAAGFDTTPGPLPPPLPPRRYDKAGVPLSPILPQQETTS